MTSEPVGRPSTSPPPSSRPNEEMIYTWSLYDDAESSLPIGIPERVVRTPGNTYIPYVGDLVNLGIVNSSTIPKFLFDCQAVDFSTIIGQGASFTVTRLRVPKQGPLEQTTYSPDFTLKFSRKVPDTPEFIAYKIARVSFEPTGEAVEKHRRAMYSALVELSALVHGPLAQHPNIVNLLGLAWGSNPFDSLHKLPILVVEYAQHGSLAELQKCQTLDSFTKLSFCLDVALGLEALHRCGIAHGDLKTENVLIFSDEGSHATAKLADFGFSIVEKSVDEKIRIGGTWPWTAPETNRDLQWDDIKYTDVYSFGLMVWRVACDGLCPFNLLMSISEESPLIDHKDRIEALKQSGEIGQLCELERWCGQFVKYQRSSNIYHPRYQPVHRSPAQSLFVFLTELLWAGILGMGPFIPGRLSAIYDISSPLDNAMGDPFYSLVDPVFKLTLQTNPPSRNLAEVITMLQKGAGREPMPILGNQKAAGTTLRASNARNSRVLSWRRVGDEAPAVQAFLVEALRKREEKAARENLVYHGDMFILAACYTNGYGVKSDYEAAKSTIRKAAHDGHYISMAYVYRICHSLFPEFQPSQKEGQGVCDLALLGCRAALEDLPELVPADVVLRAKWLLKSYRAGVGADWYTPPQMLYQLSWDKLLRALDLTGEARAEVLDPHKIISMKVNKRGDSLLHFASSCANSGALEALLSDVPFDIDSCNDQGDTALLCASRAGQVENTMLLLDRRANVNKAALTGETPLHWLISFAGEDVSLVGRKLIQSGANFEAKTVGSVAHSNFPASLEVDRLYRGTPLEWAVQRNRPDIVHFLLDEVQSSSTFWSILSQQQQPNALGWAAFYHHAECLNVMLQAMEEASLDRLAHGYMMQPLLALATSGADLFSMLLRHGSQWKQRLSATFDLLLRKSRRRNFFDGIGDEFGGTLLYHAIAGAHDTVVEYLLSTHVEQLLSEPTLEIAPASRSFPTSRGQQGNEGAGPNTAPTHPAPSLTGQGDTGGSHGFLRGMFAFLHALYTKIRTVIGGTQSAAVDAAMTITFSPPDPQRNKAGAFNPEDILRPCATSLRPPILEAIRWNRKHIYDLLLLHGADANAKSRNPFHSSSVDWTAIHTFAYAGHNADFSILKDLIHNQHHPVEGRTEGSSQTETPLLTSLCSNSFNLSNFLLSSGADINSCSTSAGLLATEHPTTILGHIIASSANGSIPRLECLCSTKSQNVEFIVEPARKLTALHRCAMGNVELWSNVDGQQLLQHECNFANNRDIMIYLLHKWGSSEEINRKCELDGATALHLAVVSANAGAVQELLATGKVDKDIKDIDGETAEQCCIKLIRHLESMAPRYAGAAPDVFENSIGPLRDIREMLQSPSMG